MDDTTIQPAEDDLAPDEAQTQHPHLNSDPESESDNESSDETSMYV